MNNTYVEKWKKIMLTVLFFNIFIFSVSIVALVLYGLRCYQLADDLKHDKDSTIIISINMLSYLIVFIFSMVIMVKIGQTMIGSFNPGKCAKMILILQPTQMLLFMVLAIVTYCLPPMSSNVPFNLHNVKEIFFPFNFIFFTIIGLEVISYIIFFPSAVRK
ncbi:hypothetical protein ACX1NB_00875 [Mycoplasma sp. HF14]